MFSLFQSGCKSSEVEAQVVEQNLQLDLLRKQVEDYKTLLDKKNEEITLLQLKLERMNESLEQIMNQCTPLILNKNYLESIIENINNLNTTIQMQYNPNSS